MPVRPACLVCLCAGVAELVDAPGLGPGEAIRGGSSPFARTTCRPYIWTRLHIRLVILTF